MASFRTLTAFLLAVPACFGEEGVNELADIPQLEIALRIAPVDGDIGTSIRGELHSGTPGTCMDLGESFRVTIAGVPVDMLYGGNVDHDFGCGDPYFQSFMRTPPTPAELVIADESATKRVDLGDQMLPAATDFIVPADHTIHPGDRLELTWSHPGDLSVGAFAAAIGGIAIGQPEQIVEWVDGDRLLAVAPDAGNRIWSATSGELCVTWTTGLTTSATVPLPCEGAVCSLHATRRACVRVTLAR